MGYRRHGHNEGDEPTFTQPELYARIKAHPTPREAWAARLVAEGVVTGDEVKRLEAEVFQRLEQIHGDLKAGKTVAVPARSRSGRPAAAARPRQHRRAA